MNEKKQYGTVHVLPQFARNQGFSDGDFMLVQESFGYRIRKENCGLMDDDPVIARFPCRIVIRSSLDVSSDARRYAQQHDCSIVGKLKGDIFLPEQSARGDMEKTDSSNDIFLLQDINVKGSGLSCNFPKRPTLEAFLIELKLSRPINTLKLAIEIEKNLGQYMTAFYHAYPNRHYLTTASHLQIPKQVRKKLTSDGLSQQTLPDLVVHDIICSNGRRKKTGRKNEVAAFQLSKNAQFKLLLEKTPRDAIVLEDNAVKYSTQIESAINILKIYSCQGAQNSVPPCILIRSASTDGGTLLADEIIQRAEIQSMTASFTELADFLRGDAACDAVLHMFNALIVQIDHLFASSDFDHSGYEDLRAFLYLFDGTKKRNPFDKAIVLVAQRTHPRIEGISTIVIDCDSIRPHNRLFEKKPSTTAQTPLKKPENSGVCLHGLEETIQTLQIAFQLQHSASRLPIRFPHGVLLHGPPGCGKTSIIKYFAQIQRMPVMHLDCSTIFSSYVGESERNLRNTFAEARAVAPCILFLDDVEAIGGKRSSETSGVDIRLLSTLLAEMDGVTPSAGVVFVGATNAPNLIDPALMRPGRFDFIIEVPLPNSDSRRSMIESILKRANTCPTAEFVDALVTITNGYSGAAVENFVHTGIRSMVTQRNEVELQKAELELNLQDFNVDDLR